MIKETLLFLIKQLHVKRQMFFRYCFLKLEIDERETPNTCRRQFLFFIVLSSPSNFSTIVSSSRTENTVQTGTEAEFSNTSRILDSLKFE